MLFSYLSLPHISMLSPKTSSLCQVCCTPEDWSAPKIQLLGTWREAMVSFPIKKHGDFPISYVNGYQGFSIENPMWIQGRCFCCCCCWVFGMFFVQDLLNQLQALKMDNGSFWKWEIPPAMEKWRFTSMNHVLELKRVPYFGTNSKTWILVDWLKNNR